MATSYLPQNGALSLLMTRHLLQVLHDADVADASSDASCAAANLLSLQLNLLDLHMPNDSSFNYRVESAHFSIAHRFHRAATLRLRSCRYLAPSPPSLPLSLPLLLLSVSVSVFLALTAHACLSNFALRIALK